MLGDVVHGTQYYDVHLLEFDDDGFNWGIVHRDYGTVEHKCFALPNAIQTANALSQALDSLTGTEGRVLSLTRPDDGTSD